VQVLAAFFIFYIIGVPIWWKTTEIYRSALPHEKISALEEEKFNFRWELQLDLIILSNANVKEEVKTQLQQEVSKLLDSSKSSSSSTYSSRFKIQVSSIMTNEVAKLDNEGIDNWLKIHYAGQQTENGKYKFFLINGLQTSHQVYLGKYRHGWVGTSLENSKEISEIAKEIARTSQVHFLSSSQESSIALRPSPEYRLSFSLLNSDPVETSVHWDFEKAFSKYLSSFLKELSVVANFTIDSQIIQFASLIQPPEFDEKSKTHFLRSSSLPHFVNPYEWKLDFTDTKTFPMLNFILYIPSKDQNPLKIKLEDGQFSKTNAFTIPQWGGIVIFNPAKNSGNLQLGDSDLLPAMQLFVAQLRELLGIPHLEKTIVPSQEKGIAEWERDNFMRRYTFDNIGSTIATLKSLSKLVQNLTNMVVLDNIGDLCSSSLDYLEKSRNSLELSQYEIAFSSSKEAFKAAEEAFFDPNMLAVLYFPNEHKYAIYALPFIPITFQIFSGIWSEFKLRRGKPKMKKE